MHGFDAVNRASGDGADYITGAKGNDLVTGSAGGDRLFRQDGNDRVYIETQAMTT